MPKKVEKSRGLKDLRKSETFENLLAKSRGFQKSTILLAPTAELNTCKNSSQQRYPMTKIYVKT